MLVYDLGMNNGDDTKYYLKKGCRVVAIEANSDLCDQVRRELKSDVDAGRLTILNVAVTDDERMMEFHIDTLNDVRSSLTAIEGRETRLVHVQGRKISSLIMEYGTPDFMKIDVEHVDELILRDMIENNIKPSLISCEAHRFEIILLLWQLGYEQFRLVNGRTVHIEYRGQLIRCVDGSASKHTFPRHSAGPFGEDLPLEWVNVRHACAEWIHRKALFGGGWYDVHAR